MRIRIFRAPTLTEAMAQIRVELGPDALILSDRRRDNFVEVTAALETSEAPELRASHPSQAGSLQTGALQSVVDDLEPFTRAPAPAARLALGPRHLAAHSPPAPLEKAPQAATFAWHGLSPGLIAALIAALGHDPLELACSRVFRFAALKLDQDDAPLMLAGPPGSGKTLTVARLATRLVLAGQHPLVITTDAKRAGAIEQLAAFTRLLGLTMVAAGTPGMLGRALQRRTDGQPVLIDLPGLDLQDDADQALLRDLLAASGATMSLVLPCGLDPNEAQDIAGAHAALGARTLIATRTDQSRRLGGILCAAAGSGLALSEAGIGSAAADSLVAMTPGFIAQRLERGDASGGKPQTSAPPFEPTPRSSPLARPDGAPVAALACGERITRSALPLHIAAQRRAASSS